MIKRTTNLKVEILWKFFRKRAGRKYHIYEEDTPKGFPPHIRSKIMEAAKELNREGYLVRFPRHKGHVWQLNMNRINEVKRMIKKSYNIP